ncbi:MAG: type ISP restriction/modification enzyme, partial [Dolichospermum sp.]
RMIDFYNSQVVRFKDYLKGKTIANADDRQKKVEEFIDNDPKQISWSRGLKNSLGKFIEHRFLPESIVQGTYRPYFKQWSFFDRDINDFVGQLPKIFPNQ